MFDLVLPSPAAAGGESWFDPTKAPWAGGLGFTKPVPDRTVSGNKPTVVKQCGVNLEERRQDWGKATAGAVTSTSPQLNPRVAETTLERIIRGCVNYVIARAQD